MICGDKGLLSALGECGKESGGLVGVGEGGVAQAPGAQGQIDFQEPFSRGDGAVLAHDALDLFPTTAILTNHSRGKPRTG